MRKEESSKSGSKDGIPSSGAELQYSRKQQREDGKCLCVARGRNDSKITSCMCVYVCVRVYIYMRVCMCNFAAKLAYLLLLCGPTV